MSEVYIQKKHIDVTELDGEWVLLNTDKLTITKLNSVGGYCWTLLQDPLSIETLTNSLAQYFSLPGCETQIKKDVTDFLTKLIKFDLVEIC